MRGFISNLESLAGYMNRLAIVFNLSFAHFKSLNRYTKTYACIFACAYSQPADDDLVDWLLVNPRMILPIYLAAT